MKQCQYAGCTNKLQARGLCQAHYYQWSKGQTLRPLRTYVKQDPAAGGKVCRCCDRFKPFSEYYRQGRESWCKPCYMARQNNKKKETV